jgi:hypothetical protein
MPNNAKTTKTKKSFKKANGNGFPDASQMLRYQGRIHLPGADENVRVIRNNLVLYSAIAANASGVIATVLGSSPSAAADWSNFAGLYDEYRTLGMEVTFCPSNQYTKGSVITTPMLVVLDRDDATAMTAYSLSSSYESCRFQSLENKWKRDARMNGGEEAVWLTTANPAAHYWFKFYAANLTALADYGAVLVTYLVEGRGRA